MQERSALPCTKQGRPHLVRFKPAKPKALRRAGNEEAPPHVVVTRGSEDFVRERGGWRTKGATCKGGG